MNNQNTGTRAGVAVIIGVVTGIVFGAIGIAVREFLNADLGAYVFGAATLLGIAAGVYYFLTSRRLV